jgi:hypothetical protein
MTDYAAPRPHDPIEEIAPDIFMVRGSVQVTKRIQTSRNMAIIRHNGELSLINPIRLTEEGERDLKELGTIKNIIRLGCFHGMDDPYYVDTFGAQMWSQEGGETYPEPAPQVVLNADTQLPFPDAQLFLFDKALQPECALFLQRENGILLTCDSIQHWGDYRFVTWFARFLLPFNGFPRTTLIGPFWLKVLTPEGESMEDEFNRLLELEFDTLLSAHGSLLETGAREAVEKAVKKAFTD